jgi:hypothetical protein
LQANDLAMDLWGAYLRQALLVLQNLQRPLAPMNLAPPWLSTLLPGWLAPPPAADPAADLAARLAVLEERIVRLEAGAPPLTAPDRDSSDTLDQLEQRLRNLEGRRSPD